MALTVEQALASAKLYTDNIEYSVISLPATAITAAAGILAEIGEPFCALIVDKDEVSLIIPLEAINDFAPRLRGFKTSEKTYRLLTFDIELEFSLVGFMAKVSTALAETGVSILPLAAYTRDHILVPADQITVAMSALEKLKSDNQSTGKT